MSKSAGWGVGGALAGLGVATLHAGHPAQTLASFAVVSLAEGLWIGLIGVEARLRDLRAASPGPPDAQYLRASWFGSPVLPLVLAATALAAVAALRHQALPLQIGKRDSIVVDVGPDLQLLANPGEAFPALMVGSHWGIEDASCPDRPNPPVVIKHITIQTEK